MGLATWRSLGTLCCSGDKDGVGAVAGRRVETVCGKLPKSFDFKCLTANGKAQLRGEIEYTDKKRVACLCLFLRRSEGVGIQSTSEVCALPGRRDRGPLTQLT